MVSGSLRDAWLDLLVRAAGGEDPSTMECPRGEHVGLDVLCHLALPDQGLGYCVIRCTHCSHGIWMSRMAVPASMVTALPAAEWPETTFDD